MVRGAWWRRAGDTAPTEKCAGGGFCRFQCHLRRSNRWQMALGLLEGDQGSADERARGLACADRGGPPDDQKVLRAPR